MMDASEAASRVEVRVARDDELADVFRLRLGWVEERGGTVDGADVVLRERVAWAEQHRDTHIPHVAVSAGVIVGMAWLALTPRVPGAGPLARICGDLQACYVLPALRNRGVGGALVDAVHATARARGAEHVTVHASERAVTLYERHGFRRSSRLLWAADVE